MPRKILSFLLIYFLLFSNFNLSFANEDSSIIDTENQVIQESSESGAVLESPIQSKNTIPDIIITFQSASYLIDKDAVQDTYHCDLNKDECKVNFDLTSPFGGYVPAKFTCINDFGFVTGEENKCNPNTIIFPYGIHTINFKMYEKDNLINYKEKTITIINEKIPPIELEPLANTGNLNQETSTGTISESGSIDSGSGIEIIDPEIIPGQADNFVSPGGQNINIVSLPVPEDVQILVTNSKEIPNLDIEIQSGLELIDSVYKCKEIDCKVNLNLEKLFTGSYESKNYSCEWNFGSGTFTTTDTDKKCNPGYVYFGTGNFNIEAKIIEKNNISNFKTGKLNFSNGIIDYFDDSKSFILLSSLSKDSGSPEGQSNTNSGNGLTNYFNDSESIPEGQSNENLTESGQLSIPNSIEIPDIDIEIQSGLEFDGSKYSCKDTNCKVNLNLENLFSGSYESKNYNCLWDFGSGSFDTIDTNKKCNPGYVKYSTGFFSINAKIEEKDNPLNYKTGSLSFYNIIADNTTLVKQKNTNDSGGGSTIIETQKNIIVQSGADKTGENTYECSDEKCKINLQYENRSNETCIWDYAGGLYKDSYTATCNPSYVYYYSGFYKISLKIFINGVLNEEKSINLKNNFFDLYKKSNLSPIAKIVLQGKLNKNKELIGNKLICKNSKTCSVNFDGSESNDANNDKLDYYWDFGNGETALKSNPASIEYLPGKYKIRLKVVDRFGSTSEDYFFVEVYENIEEVKEVNQNIIDYIKITEILPNPIGKEELERIKIKNDSLNFVNIKGLEIDDKIGEGSKSYIINNDVFLLPYQEKKFYKGETKLNLNNSFDEVNLLYNSQIIDSLVWNYEVPEDYTIKKEIKEKVKVTRVVDGDTLVIQFQDGKTEKLRFIGVDTPETKHPKKEVEKFGIEVSDYTKDMLQGKEVFLELDYENYRDKYGRLLGYIWIQETNFNKLLIEKGYARAYLYFPFKYKEEFEKAEKEAKKNKLGIWGNDEIKKEMQILEKIEKEQDLENIKMKEEFSLQNIIGKMTKLFDFRNYSEILTGNNNLWFLNFSVDKKEIEKERLKEFDLLVKELLEDDNNNSKIITKKQEKIITYKTSRLKSGLKITGVTFPNSLVIVSFDDIIYKTNSDSEGKYLFLISNNLKVGDYKLDFVVLSGEKEYTYQAPKDLVLSKDYIFGVQDYLVKKSTKNTKNKKVKKSKKKKVLVNNNTKKIKYDVKDIKKVEDKSSTKNIIYIFLLSLITSVLGYFIITKKNLD